MLGDVVTTMKTLRIVPLLLLLFSPPLHAACGNGCPKGIGLPYPLAYFFGDTATDLQNETFACIAVPNATSIPANLARSVCTATAAATGNTVFTVTDAPYGRGPNTIATLTFGPGSATCTLSQQAAIPVSAKDTLCVAGPATADTTLAGVAITIYSITTDYP